MNGDTIFTKVQKLLTTVFRIKYILFQHIGLLVTCKLTFFLEEDMLFKINLNMQWHDLVFDDNGAKFYIALNNSRQINSFNNNDFEMSALYQTQGFPQHLFLFGNYIVSISKQTASEGDYFIEYIDTNNPSKIYDVNNISTNDLQNRDGVFEIGAKSLTKSVFEGNMVYIVDSDAKSFYAINTVKFTENKIEFPESPNSLDYSNGELFVGFGDNGFVRIIDAESFEIKEKIITGATFFDMAIGKDGNIYVTNSDLYYNLHSISRMTGKQVSSVRYYPRSGYFVTHPIYDMFYYTDINISPQDITAIVYNNGNIMDVYGSPYHGDYRIGENIKVSPDGKYIFTSAGSVFNSSPVQDDDIRYNNNFMPFNDMMFDLSAGLIYITDGRDFLVVYDYLSYTEKGYINTKYPVRDMSVENGLITVLSCTSNNYYLELIDSSNITNNVPLVKIPDGNFKRALIKAGVDTDGDGEINYFEAEAVSDLNLSCSNISDITCIEHFTALKKLDVSNNDLTYFDISSNKTLEVLNCSGNMLTSLDVISNKVLVDLNCRENQLTDLYLNFNYFLETLNCGNNQLRTLMIYNNRNLINLYCDNNQIFYLNLDYNQHIEVLDCGFNEMFRLDVSNNVGLKQLYCDGNWLTTVDTSKNQAIELLDCGYNQIWSLDVSKNFLLEQLYCDNNQIRSIDISNNRLLKVLDCGYNQLKSLDTSKNFELEVLICLENDLTSLDVSYNQKLRRLDCSLNNIPSISQIIGRFNTRLPLNEDGTYFIFNPQNYTAPPSTPTPTTTPTIEPTTTPTPIPTSIPISIPTPTPVPKSSSVGGYGGYSGGYSSGGGSSSGSRSVATPTSKPPANAPQTVTQDVADAAVKKAIETAKAANSVIATVNLRNPGDISDVLLKFITDSGITTKKTMRLVADSLTTDNKAVEARITLNPTLSKNSLNLSASTSNTQALWIKNYFNKYFKNELMAVSFGHQGSFGQEVRVAVKLDPSLKTNKLTFYMYSKETNKYKQILTPKHMVDKNGYVQFSITNGGDILISDGPLVRK